MSRECGGRSVIFVNAKDLVKIPRYTAFICPASPLRNKLRLVPENFHGTSALFLRLESCPLAGGFVQTQEENTVAKHPASDHHHQAASHHQAAAHHHQQAAHHHEHGEHEEATKHSHTAQTHSEAAQKHTTAAHGHSQKK
jgi:hypothetical protein